MYVPAELMSSSHGAYVCFQIFLLSEQLGLHLCFHHALCILPSHIFLTATFLSHREPHEEHLSAGFWPLIRWSMQKAWQRLGAAVSLLLSDYAFFLDAAGDQVESVRSLAASGH